MDEETTTHAQLIASVICRVVDYYVVTNSLAMRANGGKDVKDAQPARETAERAVRVAIENVIDSGALK